MIEFKFEYSLSVAWMVIYSPVSTTECISKCIPLSDS